MRAMAANPSKDPLLVLRQRPPQDVTETAYTTRAKLLSWKLTITPSLVARRSDSG